MGQPRKKVEQRQLDDLAGKLGQEIRRRRLKEDWAQEDLAQLAGVRLLTISRAERGVRVPDNITLVRIAGAFGLTVEQLFRSSFSNAIRYFTHMVPDQQQVLLAS